MNWVRSVGIFGRLADQADRTAAFPHQNQLEVVVRHSAAFRPGLISVVEDVPKLLAASDKLDFPNGKFLAPDSSAGTRLDWA